MTEGKEKERASGERNSGEKEMFSLICATAVPHLFYASSVCLYIFLTFFQMVFSKQPHYYNLLANTALTKKHEMPV